MKTILCAKRYYFCRCGRSIGYDIIKNEQKKFNSKNWGIEKDPMEELFDNDSQVMRLIK